VASDLNIRLSRMGTSTVIRVPPSESPFEFLFIVKETFAPLLKRYHYMGVYLLNSSSHPKSESSSLQDSPHRQITLLVDLSTPGRATWEADDWKATAATTGTSSSLRRPKTKPSTRKRCGPGTRGSAGSSRRSCGPAWNPAVIVRVATPASSDVQAQLDDTGVATPSITLRLARIPRPPCISRVLGTPFSVRRCQFRTASRRPCPSRSEHGNHRREACSRGGSSGCREGVPGSYRSPPAW
jgi:hypothetical protein